MAKSERKPKKIGLALGGGGAKGFAHIGVIKVLVDAGIPIDCIAGTSMGALVGGYYAATKNVRRLEALALNFDAIKIFPSTQEVVHDKGGALFRGTSIEHALEEEFHKIKIEDLEIPFIAIATDAKNGDEVRISKGSLVEAIRASIALPVVFSPVEHQGKLLIDGGLANPVPADVVREMGAEYVIAVDVSSKWLEAPENLVNIHDMHAAVDTIFSVIENQIAKNVLKSADIVLRPSVMRYEGFSFSNSADIIERGEWVTDYSLSDIRKGSGYTKVPESPIEKFLEVLFG